MTTTSTIEYDGRLVVRLPRTLLERLTELARSGDRTVAAEARRALRAHVERERRRERPK
jgi:predicted transcriptional regulator